MEQLSGTKADLTRERAELLAEVSRLRSQLDRAMSSQDDTEKRRMETEARMQNMTQEMQVGLTLRLRHVQELCEIPRKASCGQCGYHMESMAENTGSFHLMT